ncbi:MAG: insulinase family protein [Spirochaetales bacterium]|nr:insulinase family protein [Spirochaetales bacterium]
MNVKRIFTRKGMMIWLILGLALKNIFSLATGEIPSAEIGSGPEILTLTLDNGIPLLVQESDTSSVRALKLFLKGQAQYGEPGKDGIEKMTLSLLAHGSENYSWEEVQTILHEKSSAVGAFAEYFDYSGFSLMTLDKYYGEIYDLFRDEILNPSWDADEFGKVKNGLLMARTQKEADPYSLASQILSDEFFGSHAYQTDIDGSLETLDTITLEDVKAYYRSSLTADRVFFVAVGNFDAARLREELNRDFGSLPLSGKGYTPVPALIPLKESRLIKEVFDDSPGLAYVRGNWVLPEMSREDKAALDLALSLLDDILFQVVRTENSACYSVWANLYDFQAKYACFGVYKTQVPFEVEDMIKDAVDILASGRCVYTSPGGADSHVAASFEGADPYVPIDRALDFYKSQFVTEFYTDQQTNASIAEQIGKSYLYEGDPAAFRSESDYWNRVTAGDIVRAVNLYVKDQPVMWIALGGGDVIE